MQYVVLFYAYLFFNQTCVNIKRDVLGLRTFPSLVERLVHLLAWIKGFIVMRSTLRP